MVEVTSYWISSDHLIWIKSDKRHRKYQIVVDEERKTGFTYDVSLTQGKGVVDFLERLRGFKDSNPVVQKVLETPVSPGGKRGRKRKLKGQMCKDCDSPMTRLYVHSNAKGEKQWVPVWWYCDSCKRPKARAV